MSSVQGAVISSVPTAEVIARNDVHMTFQLPHSHIDKFPSLMRKLERKDVIFGLSTGGKCCYNAQLRLIYVSLWYMANVTLPKEYFPQLGILNV